LPANEVSEAQSLVSEWVDLQKLISEERSSWETEKEVVSDMISLLAREKKSLLERIELAKTATSDADEKRSSLLEQRDEFIAAMDFLGGQIESLEALVRELHTKFPPPLQEEVSVSYNRMPEPGEKSRLSVSQRLQSVIVILSQADKFNGGIQLVSGRQELEGGSVEVETLYFGLGGAFFKDKAGEYAGVGYPGESGWEWVEKPEAAADIETLLAVYQGSKQAEFVGLPVIIK